MPWIKGILFSMAMPLYYDLETRLSNQNIYFHKNSSTIDSEPTKCGRGSTSRLAIDKPRGNKHEHRRNTCPVKSPKMNWWHCAHFLPLKRKPTILKAEKKAHHPRCVLCFWGGSWWWYEICFLKCWRSNFGYPSNGTNKFQLAWNWVHDNFVSDK